jgi:CRISPR-associated endonuclease/helicase Cas3
MHFALLNNDALWLLDETQLMGPGLWTSAQLDWLRNDRFKPLRPCATWWLSATIGKTFLDTKDRQNATKAATLEPLADTIKISSSEDAKLTILKAERPVEFWTSITKKSKGKAKNKDSNHDEIFIATLSQAICNEHQPGFLSLVVCNKVDTAQTIFKSLKLLAGEVEIVLLTSRFRVQDRRRYIDKLLAFEDARKQAVREQRPCDHPGLICVSTQVVEAGIDVSARRLWTELAPWPSILQRLGRLNRDATLNNEAHAFVFEIPIEKFAQGKSVFVGPYSEEDIKDAKKIISVLSKQCVENPDKPIRKIIDQLKSDKSINERIEKSLQPKPEPFPRAYDLHGLFSTEPDAFGGFTDVSPWIRGTDTNADVTVFWRDWDETRKPLKRVKTSELIGPTFQRQEGCAVTAFKLHSFVEKTKIAYVWNDKEDQWEAIRKNDICPGMVILLPAGSGGYSEEIGWTGNRSDRFSTVPLPGPYDADGDRDTLVVTKLQWVSLEDHSTGVSTEATRIGADIGLPPALQAALFSAGALHDIGKSLLQWQEALPENRPDRTTLWAKAPRFAKRANMRHEAASALALWHRYYRVRTARFPAITIYLVAAHHGLVRTVLSSRSTRPLPNVAGIPITDPPLALLWGKDVEEDWPLDFNCAQDGTNGEFSEDADGNLLFTPAAPGWTALVADLLGGWEANAPSNTAGAVPENDANEPHSLNPFNLAWLETLLRAADCRISAIEPGFPEPTIP